MVIMILEEHPVCCGWTRGWVIKNQPEKMTENCTPLINAGPRLQRLPITRDLSPSKESDKVAFWWTSIKEKPLKLF